MPDINVRKSRPFDPRGQPDDGARFSKAGAGARPLGRPLEYELIELLFFAYRDFVADADAVLVGYGFGRAHHRVLHFVDRHPGLKVADLLDILRITKQSLGRVLKQLIDGGFIIQREGNEDRRQRLLSPTRKGKALAAKLADLQSRRFTSALSALGPDARKSASEFLFSLVDREKQAFVSSLIHASREKAS